jgi:hypothetical protein
VDDEQVLCQFRQLAQLHFALTCCTFSFGCVCTPFAAAAPTRPASQPPCAATSPFCPSPSPCRLLAVLAVAEEPLKQTPVKRKLLPQKRLKKLRLWLTFCGLLDKTRDHINAREVEADFWGHLQHNKTQKMSQGTVYLEKRYRESMSWIAGKTVFLLEIRRE